MANTQTFTGDGITTSFYFTFPFFGVNDIKVSVDDVAQTSDDIAIYPTTTPGDAPDVPYTGGRIDFATAPTSGAIIKVWRNIEIARHIDYQPTSEPKSHQLNQDLNQCIEILKEQSGKLSVLDDLDMDVIENVGTTVTNHIANTNNPHSVTIAQIGALSSSTKYGASLVMSMDSSTYVVTLQLKDQDGNALGSAQTIDLPLESVVVSGSYDSDNKKVILTLKNGSTIEFSVADLIDGLQATIDANNKLSADLVSDTSTTNKFVTASDITNWNGKANSADLATVATTGTLASLNDATISTPSDGQVLMYDDGVWKNTTSTASVAWGGVTGTLSDQTDLKNALDAKQGTLTAGSNITISSGTISATDTTYSVMTGADGTNAGTSGLVPAPAATDNTKFLRGDGTWATASGGSSLPSQTGNSGKFLTTDGTDASWANVPSTSIEYATYGTTTYQQISDWLTAGKDVVCIYNGITYRYGYDSAGHWFVCPNPNAINLVYVQTNDTWTSTQQLKQNQMQYSTMPTANIGNSGKIVQYVGTTDQDYTNGYFYVCVGSGSPVTYSWQRLDLQPAGGGSLPDQTGNAGKFLTTDGTDASWANALTNESTSSSSISIGTSLSKGNSVCLGYYTSLGSQGQYAVLVGNSTYTNKTYATGIGYLSRVEGSTGTAIGYSSQANGIYSVALGASAVAQSNYSIQLGKGTNSTLGSLSVGLALDNNSYNNYTLLTVDGLIPADRIASTTGLTNGNYRLRLTMADGTPTLSWVAE